MEISFPKLAQKYKMPNLIGGFNIWQVPPMKLLKKTDQITTVYSQMAFYKVQYWFIIMFSDKDIMAIAFNSST